MQASFTGNNPNTPQLVEPTTVEENFGGIWLWFQTSSFNRHRGFRIEWEVQDPTTTTGAPTPPPKGKTTTTEPPTPPPKGKDFD